MQLFNPKYLLPTVPVVRFYIKLKYMILKYNTKKIKKIYIFYETCTSCVFKTKPETFLHKILTEVPHVAWFCYLIFIPPLTAPLHPSHTNF